MANEPVTAAAEQIGALILTVRGQRVMLDSDLAHAIRERGRSLPKARR